jgi:serine phosphatase RsbU (regulator of sigma subunit)
MKIPDYDKAVKITDHAYWVGTYDPTDRFQCNSYLILLDDRGIIIDPGSVLYLESLLRKVTQLIELKNISHIIIQHQDPDVAGNIAMLMERIRSSDNPICKIVTHERTSALIRHYGGNLKFEYSNRLSGEILQLGNDNELHFIHTPYLHAPGAIATYFNTDKVLFSGDIFGGMTDNWQLFAGDNYFQEISAFHKEYMPSKELLLFSMTKFEHYDIERIAPQHGSVMNRKQAAAMIEAFKDFDCGLYIDTAFRNELQAARKKIEEQNKIMSEELSIAADFQQTLLPDKKKVEEWNHRIDIAYLFKPFSQVSGDFLIIDQIDDQHLGIMVIDVVGHGVTPGLATIQIKTLFDEHKRISTSPAEVIKKINEKAFTIYENNIFLTILYAIYNFNNSSIALTAAGGVPPVYFNAAENSGSLVSLIGNPLGVREKNEFQIDETKFYFKKNDVLILQTDGLIESTDENDEPFERIKSQKQFIEAIRKDRSSQQILDAVMEKVNVHKGKNREFTDDVTIAVIRKR